ncbi:hypothetical protein SADUNF_Sadunf06G0182000 [Salix dunnii]|uniref:Uncharacterized protein n=1 Tax=Salix dunnii TaxID=1413687 RepID=A0A835K2V7_9ROSI|nr:hypothetical protein SADUNF_Sadunf06G0182000 [Salix dunnii]
MGILKLFSRDVGGFSLPFMARDLVDLYPPYPVAHHQQPPCSLYCCSYYFRPLGVSSWFSRSSAS